MEQKLITDEVLENVTGAGVALPDLKYEIGDDVVFRENGNDGYYGDIIAVDYCASQKTWIYVIHTGEILPHYIPEKDILRKQ